MPKPSDGLISQARIAARRVGSFGLAVLLGVAVPLSPLGAEYFVTADIAPGSWSAVGVTYIAGVGLASRNKGSLVFMVGAAGIVAFIYGVDMQLLRDHVTPNTVLVDPNRWSAKLSIAVAVLWYSVERFWRHAVDGETFLEI